MEDSLKELLAEKNAVAYAPTTQAGTPLSYDNEIVRAFPMAVNAVGKCMAELERVVTVTDPYVDRVKYPGLYRQSSLRVEVNRSGEPRIVQVLRRGLMDSPIWEESRIYNDRKLPGNNESVTGLSNTTSHNPERYVIAEFKAVNPKREVEFMAALSAQSHTDRSVGGQTLSGEWRTIWTQAEVSDDGSLTFRILLALPQFTLKGYTDFGGINESDVTYLWNVPKPLAKPIMDGFKALSPTVGRTATSSYNTAQGVVDIVLRKRNTTLLQVPMGTMGRSCSYDEVATYHYNVTDPATVTIPTESLTLADNIGKSYKREVSNNGDGTWTIIIVTRTRNTQGPLEFVSEISKARKITSRETRGWKTGYTAYDTIYPQADPPQVGTTYSREVSINEDCTLDIVDRVAVSRPLDSANHRKSILETLSDGSGKQNSALADAAAAQATEPVQGEIVVFSEKELPDGTKAWELSTDTSPVLDTYEKTATIKATAEEIGQQNKRDPMPTPTPATLGRRVTFKRVRNTDGTYTYTELIENSAAGGTTKGRTYVVASCRTLSTAQAENNIATDLLTYTPETPPAGVTRTVRLTEHIDGSWDREIIDETAPQLATTEIVVVSSGGTTATTLTGQTGTKPAAPVAEQNKVKTLRIEDRPDCSWVKTESSETIPPLAGESVRHSASATAYTNTETDATDEISTLPEAYAVVEASYRQKKTGGYDNQRTVINPIAQSTGWISYPDGGGTSYFIAFSNQSLSYLTNTVLAAFETTRNNSLSSRLNEFGLYDGTAQRSFTLKSGGSSENEIIAYDVTYYVLTTLGKFMIHDMVTSSKIAAEALVETDENNPHAYCPGQPAAGIDNLRDGYFRATSVTLVPP